MVSIYKLVDPRDGGVRYVGASRDPRRRYGRPPIRLGKGNGNPALREWETELAADGRCIRLEVIEVVPDEQRIERERFWISHYSKVSLLLCNVRDKPTDTARTDKLEVGSIALLPAEWRLLDNIVEDDQRFRSRNELIRRCLHVGIKDISRTQQ